MREDSIAQVGIDVDGRLYVKPTSTSFDYIYRAGMEVGWDSSERRLFSPRPREWTYLDWFKQILAAVADEYRTRLRLTPETVWSNVPTAVRAEISSLPEPSECPLSTRCRH
jgi:hypothetical protein